VRPVADESDLRIGGRAPRCFVVPHTHWDREWYRPLEHFRLELARVVDAVLDTLERDPDYRSFTLDGQAVVLEDYLEVRPEHEGRLRALLAAGRIEIGPSYVLPDEFLVGAEPLVRNLLMGRTVCERLGGVASPVGYLPDSFGHPLQMPQILAGFGIANMIFSRGLGDQLDTVGVVFRWRAPDGSEVLALQQLPHYENFVRATSAEAGERELREILERFGELLAGAGVGELLLCHGSDHRPVNPDLPRMCAELEQRLPGSTFAIAGFADYVRAVGAPQVPAWSGELLGSRLQNVLRGVNSARMYVKTANERAERRLLAAETLAALHSLHRGVAFPSSDFALAWRELLRCHPHDTICGCSCDEVHVDALARYASLQRTLDWLQWRALDGLAPDASRGDAISVLNPLPYARRDVLEAPGCEPVLFEVGGFAATTVTLTPARAAISGAPADGEAAIESDLLRVEAAADGTLSILDKSSGRRLRGLHGLEDEADMGDLYNFCPLAGGALWQSTSAVARVLCTGPVVSELELRVEAERPAGLDGEFRPLAQSAPVLVTTVVRLVQGSGGVEFTTTVENATRDHRLRVRFPVETRAEHVRAEGHFAMVQRALAPAPPQAEWLEPPDATQHTLGAVALGPLALLTKGLPDYEARVVGERSELCLTLLRCVGLISRPAGVLATRPTSAGPQLATPGGQCLGRHQFEYALRLDAEALDDVALLRESLDYRAGFVTVAGALALEAPLALEGDVVFSALKGAQDGDGLIVRCFNPSQSAASARVVGELTVSETRLDETGERALPDGTLHLAPGRIATLRLRAN
jgi:alpha-mannosidase/mannosylglycerate hydrolase